MALTARGGVLALLGALVVGLVWPSGLAVLVITGLIVVGIGVDIVLAPSVRRLVLRRDGDTAVRLGERATVSLLVANPGSRRVRRSGTPGRRRPGRSTTAARRTRG